jgi:hypothetical protein
MDLFGKTLVVVNLGLSLMMAAVGGAVLYYHVDWTDNAATADQPAGLLAPREEQYEKLSGFVLNEQSRAYDKRTPGLIDAADAAWRDARAQLPLAEDRRIKDQVWYAEELEHLRTNPKQQPILQLAYDKGRTTPDPKNGGLPAMQPGSDRYGQPLLSIKASKLALAGKNDDIDKVLAALDKSLSDDAEATMHLLGSREVQNRFAKLKDEYKDDEVRKKVQDKLTALMGQLKDERGLIHRIADEKVKLEDLAKEIELVKLAEGQVRADSQLLLLRKKALEARVKELASVTRKQP